MQRNYIHYIYILILTILAACSDSAAIIEEKPEQEHDGIELTGIKAVVAGSSTSTTRSSADEYNTDYVGRSTFINDDEMIITKFERTQAALSHYSYKNIFYKSNSDLAWARTKGDGVNGYEAADRIYWSDNASYHTFIGYSLPQDWKRADSDKWKADASDASIFHGQFSTTTIQNGSNSETGVDFSAIEDNFTPDVATGGTEKVYQNGKWIDVQIKQKVDYIGSRLKNEDLLLFYNTEQLADIGGMTTTLHYRHALASLRVIIDIREFAVNYDTQDAKTSISDLRILRQPWKYKWTQQPTPATEENEELPGWGVVNDMQLATESQAADPTVTIKAWQPRPEKGEGSGSNRTFTFYSLIVPGAQSNFEMHYKVTYPNALKPNEMVHNTYSVHMNEIMFKAGYCTTVRVSLNHQGEPINIGAMYYNWDDVSTPDKSNLQKVSTFLDTSVRDSVTIAGDTKATIEDATWLYINGDKLVDIYGNDGSQSNPFTIKTARQFLSFAYEVNSGNNGEGRTFNDQYVKLEADLFLQPENTESKWTINWPGIGTADKPFNGYFDGGNRIIKLLKGKPLFTNIGANAHIETLQLEDVIGDINGGGCLAEVNNGTLCGCHVYAKNNKEINLTSTSTSASSETYSGFICGVNNGTIFACKTQGDFKSAAQYTGGITGKNEGAIVASIAIGKISSSYSTPIYGGISAQNGTSSSVTTCFFDKDKMKGVTAGDMDTCGKTTTEMQKEGVVNALNEEIQKNSDDHFKSRNYTFHVGQYPRVH